MSDLDENKLIVERKSKLALLREEGNPYVNDFKPLNLALDIHSKFDENSNEELQDIKESVDNCWAHHAQEDHGQSKLCAASRYLWSNSTLCHER